MVMVAETSRKNTNINKNVTKAAYIQYQLKRNGFTQAQIAKELNINPVAVSRSFYGLSKISRVDNWLADNLGLEVVNG